jgi:hypothetical protein
MRDQHSTVRIDPPDIRVVLDIGSFVYSLLVHMKLGYQKGKAYITLDEYNDEQEKEIQQTFHITNRQQRKWMVPEGNSQRSASLTERRSI